MSNRIRTTLRAALVAAPLVLGMAPGVRAQEVPIPQTPAGERLVLLLEVLQQTDTASIRTFVETGMSAEFQALPFQGPLDVFTQTRADLAGARIVAIESPQPLELAATLLAGGERYQILLAVEEAAPHRVTGIRMGREPEPQAAAPETLTTAQVREIADSTAAQVEREYVIPDTGVAIARHLRARLAAGAYDALTRPAELSEALTADLRAVNGDGHLYMVVNTAPAVPGGGGGSPENDGIVRVERLEGNVGYLRLSSISGAPSGREAMLNALQLLGRTDAVILDLRGVPGGSGNMANFIISHFTPPEVPSLRVSVRGDAPPRERATLADVPGPRRTEVPLYVLTDRGSASAAEDIPFVLQNLERATIVGERTAGAGRNNRTLPVPHGMGVSVSVTRVTDPRTGREWEGVGVVPQVQSASEEALEVAHQHALAALAAAEQDAARRAMLERTREFVAARAAPVAVSARDMAGYAGRYESGRSITIRQGQLYYQSRDGAQPTLLVPLGSGRFAANPGLRVVFAGEGADARIEVTSGTQAPRVFRRLP